MHPVRRTEGRPLEGKPGRLTGQLAAAVAGGSGGGEGG